MSTGKNIKSIFSTMLHHLLFVPQSVHEVRRGSYFQAKIFHNLLKVLQKLSSIGVVSQLQSIQFKRGIFTIKYCQRLCLFFCNFCLLPFSSCT